MTAHPAASAEPEPEPASDTRSPAEVEIGSRVDPVQAARLVAAAVAADGVRPLSEAAELRLRAGGAADPAVRAVSDAAGRLVGLAVVEAVPGEAPVAELVVDPGARGRGVGRALLADLRRRAPGGLRVWSHADLPAARALALAAGGEPARLLHRMRRPLAPPLPAPPDPPPGVRLRTFRPGSDEPAWLAVNARAFADHPEQGRWTAADLAAREAEPWFDPDGFFLAEREEPGAEPALLGFHWTKVEGGAGEVYVVGVDPDAQGRGLGRLLVLVGLARLRDLGLAESVLYVDEDNASAVALYRSLGFDVEVTDVLWAFPPAA